MSVRYLVTVFVTLIFLLIASGTSDGAPISVDDDGVADYDNIQEAIDNANDGDVINVADGSYEGNLVIYVANLTIQRTSGTVIIDGNSTENGSYIIADGVSLINLNFSNSKKSGGGVIYAGVYVDANDVTIETCELYDNKYGVFAATVSGLTVTDCDLIENRWGVFLTQCGDSVLEGLGIFNSVASGITVYTSSDITIGGSGSRPLFVRGSPAGVQILGGSTAVTVDMTGTEFSQYGIEVDKVTNIDLTIELWNLSAGGIKIEESTLIDVTGTIEADGRCVYVTESTGVVLMDMYLNGTDAGVQKKGLYLHDGSYVTGDNIYFGNLRWAIYLENKCNASLTDVTFYGATSYIYDSYSWNSRLILLNVDYLNASTGQFYIRDSGWVSSRNIVNIEVDQVTGAAAQNADVKVSCEEGTLYASSGYSGSDPKTDTLGKIPGIEMPYLFANLSGVHQNVTEIEIDTGTWIGTRPVDTSVSGDLLIVANDPAELEDGTEPDYYISGDMHFNCIYTDPEGQAPDIKRIWIDDTSYDMTLDGNTTYDEGALFTYTTELLRGSYSYWFEFRDTRLTTTTNETDLDIHNAPPVMVLPVKTESLPFIKFTINYTDKEGDAPLNVSMNIDGVNHTMYRTDVNETDYVNGTMYNISVLLDNGIFPYYFIGYDGTNWTPPSVPVDLSVDYIRPVLSEGGVSPVNGRAGTEFTFKVTYQHTDGIYPDDDRTNGSPHVFFNNRSWDMDREDEISPIYGTSYSFSTSGIPHGNYSFYFNASDDTFATMTESSNLIIDNTASTIEFRHNPDEGDEEIPYDLTITVTDPDNDPVEYLEMTLEGRIYTWGSSTLPLYEKDVDDDSTFNGKEFWMKISGLHNGFRSYEIEASDGMEVTILEGSFPVDIKPVILPRVDPMMSDENTLVRFKCTYSDDDGNWPDGVSIFFVRDSDGRIYGPYDMEEKDSTDKTVSDGKDYLYSRTFGMVDTDFGADSYHYMLEVSDGILNTTSSWLPFNVLAADNPPALTNWSFMPSKGSPTTVFTFEVTYSDPDGDEPTEIIMLFNQNFTSLDLVDPNYEPTTEDYIAGVKYRIKMEMTYSGDYSISFRAKSKGGDKYLEAQNITGQSIRVRADSTDTESISGGDDFFMLIIVLAIVIPVAIGLLAGLLTRTKKRAKTPAEKDKKEKEEDVDWSFDDEDEEAEDEDEDEEDIDWE